MRLSTIVFLVIFLVLIGLIAGAGISINSLMKKKAEAEVKTVGVSIPVHVLKIESRDVEDIVEVTGQIEPAHRVDVFAKIPVPGKLIEAKVIKGERVEQDAALVSVDRDEVGAYYKPYVVKAPISGTVIAITDSPGAIVAAQAPVATIVNTDEVKVKTSVIEADLARVKEGTPARVMVDAYPDRVFEGSVSRIDPILDPISHTARVEILIDNSDGSLLSGMFAHIKLVADTHSGAPVITKEATYTREGKMYAFVVDPQAMVLKLTEIKLGYYDTKVYEVLEGVKEGDLVVDRELVVLKHLTKVFIVNPDGKEPEPAPAEGSTTGVAEGSTAGTVEGSTAGAEEGSTVQPAPTEEAGSTASPSPGEAAGSTAAPPANP